MERRQRRRRVDKINKMENVQCIHVISNCFLFIIYGTIRANPRHHQHITESFVSSCFFHPFSCGWKIEENSGTNLCRTETRESDWPSSHLSDNGKWYVFQFWADIGHYEPIFILRWCEFSPLFSSRIRWRPAGECKHHSRVPVGLCVCVGSLLFHPFLIVFTFIMTRIKCPCAMFGLVSRISRTVVHTYGKLCVIGVLNTNTNDINSFHRWTNMY